MAMVTILQQISNDEVAKALRIGITTWPCMSDRLAVIVAFTPKRIAIQKRIDGQV
jgi:hypothetical protein